MASLLNMSGGNLLKKGLPQGAVDMGLPSGTLWAQGNIVKDANDNYAIGEPTDYGCYFSWGNIDGHNNGDGYIFNSGSYALTPGKQVTEYIPNNDSLHDAAVANIGNGWHMPNTTDFQELLDSSNCTYLWTQINDKNGLLITSKANGNTLFFPASGYNESLTIRRFGVRGFYWSRIAKSGTTGYLLFFTSDTVESDHLDNRYGGLSIRPVITI